MQLPNNGKHLARTDGAMVVYVADSGSLCVAIPTTLEDGSWSGKGTMTLVNKDGERKDKAIHFFRKTFGWDTEDFFDLESIPVGEHQFSITGKQEPYTPQATDENPTPEETMGFKIEWFNVIGESGVKMPEKVDDKTRRALLTKYARHFKVSPGSKPAASAKSKPAAEPEPEEQQELAAEEATEEQQEEAEAPAPAPSRPSAPVRPAAAKTAGGQARTLTADEVWTLLFKKNPKVKQPELEKTYWAAADKIVPGNDGNNITPAQWGRIATELGV